MLGLTMKEDQLVPVEQDPNVQKAMERLTAARTALDALAVEEHRLIKLVTGREDASSDEREEARRLLDVEKGTQDRWYLGTARVARDEVKQAEHALQKAVGPARTRLTETATSKIAALTKQLDEDLEPARQLAIEIQHLRQEMSDGGTRSCEHSCPALLPGGIVEFQMELARKRGWI